jgi:hypothetical protein
MQNFAPLGFSAEQFWQRIDLPQDRLIQGSESLGLRAALQTGLMATKKSFIFRPFRDGHFFEKQ